MRTAVFVVLLALSSLARADGKTWMFRVYLDGREIGYHRFTLEERGAERELRSEARFAIDFLFFNAYRYRHDALERWRGDCLRSLVSRTDDDGERLQVDWREADGCAMSFAYWNPRILDARRLLNAQTGAFEPVRVSARGPETLEVRGRPVSARRYRLSGDALQIDLWYAGDEWVALESTLRGGSRLRYALGGDA